MGVVNLSEICYMFAASLHESRSAQLLLFCCSGGPPNGRGCRTVGFGCCCRMFSPGRARIARMYLYIGPARGSVHRLR